MRFRLQLAACLLALELGTVMAIPASAQRGRVAHWSPGPQQHRPPAAQQPRGQQQRPPANKPVQPVPQQKRQGGGNPQGNANRPNTNPNGNPNRPPSAYTPPPAPQRKFNDLSPADKQKVLENNRKYQSLTPYQRQQMHENEKIWDRLTPAQKNHIRNDVLPKWRAMPVERRQAIRQRLQILQNMPESAKNQRLNDPNFTRGMSEEDKGTLRDLSHLHVGGPPDSPPIE